MSLWPLKTQHRGTQEQRPGSRADLHGIEAETMPGRVIDQGQDLAGVPAGVCLVLTRDASARFIIPSRYSAGQQSATSPRGDRVLQRVIRADN